MLNLTLPRRFLSRVHAGRELRFEIEIDEDLAAPLPFTARLISAVEMRSGSAPRPVSLACREQRAHSEPEAFGLLTAEIDARIHDLTGAED